MNAYLASRFRFLLLVLVIFSVAACSTFDSQVVRTQTHGKSIAVASTLGPDLGLTWIGTTIVNAELGRIPVTTWNIDELATRTASSALQATRRYAAVTEFSGIYRIGNKIPRLPEGSQADFLLLLQPLNAGDPIYNSDLSLTGMGVAQRTFLGMEAPTYAHVGVTGELFDMAAVKSMGAISKFYYWKIPVKLKSGGSPKEFFGKRPVPKIDDRDLNDLQQPFAMQLVNVVEKLVDDMALR